MRLALVLALIAAPAAAQDPAAEYDAAVRAFVLPGQEGGDVMAEDDAVIALLPGLEGDWAPASVLAAGGSLDPALVAEVCGEAPLALARTAPRSFEMRRPYGEAGATLATRYDYLQGNTFQRSVPEADLLAYMGFPEGVDVPPAVFAGMGRGEVLLFHPSSGLLVVHPVGGRAEVYARCP
jgi:hypothetical protein